MMDPNLFFVDWERLFEVMVMIVVLSFFVERALSPLFESNFYINKFRGKSVKEVIAFALGALVCWHWDFDAFSILLTREKVTLLGAGLTGAIIAGGSKGSIKLFRDVFKFRSTAENTRLKIIEGAGGKRQKK
jgi:hypothetical protein